MARYLTTISHVNKDQMLDLKRKYKINIVDHSQSSKSGTYSVDAILEPAEIQTLRQAGYQLQQREDVDEKGRARQAEVGKGNRYQR